MLKEQAKSYYPRAIKGCFVHMAEILEALFGIVLYLLGMVVVHPLASVWAAWKDRK